MKLTRAVHHIRLSAANGEKLAQLDALAVEYLALCQQYVTLFCTEEPPEKYLAPRFESLVSERWQRVAIQQAAGIAQSWQSNRANAATDYLDALAEYEEHHQEGEPAPTWTDWRVSFLKETMIQANANVVTWQSSRTTTFDGWLKVLTFNQAVRDHPGCQFAYEQLNVAGMHFKARRMNAYLYASNLGHIPCHLAWVVAKGGGRATRVKSVYSSQECSRCHYTDPQNRPTQQTFCCGVCGWTCHADVNAALNLASRLGDQELAECQSRKDIKALLVRRHEAWRQFQGMVIVHPPT